MDNSSTKKNYGMIGLGTMGRNLALNIADNGFTVSGYDKSEHMLNLFHEIEQSQDRIYTYPNLSDFIDSLESPRKIILLVPAGPIVDQVIQEITPYLNQGDIVIDSGNSYFADTQKRSEKLNQQGIHFFGMGISGGEEGARFGPSLMPGGNKVAYDYVKPMLEAVSAKFQGQPCVRYVGSGSAGHFVKMTHNGIEYAIMQLLSEVYGLFKNGLNYSNEQLSEVFENWNQQELKSFLVEITADIFKFKDTETGKDLIDLIKDQAKSKGTGKWTSQIAMDLEVPIPTIDIAVTARYVSKLKTLRIALEELFLKPQNHSTTTITEADISSAYTIGMMCAYAQGLHLLQVASKEYQYDLKIDDIAQIWKAGCIIRSSFLENIYQAYHQNQQLNHLFADPQIAEMINQHRAGLEKVIALGHAGGFNISALSSSLNYIDQISTANLPSNLTQAQRDYFGAHTFERIDKEGVFHAQWTK